MVKSISCHHNWSGNRAPTTPSIPSGPASGVSGTSYAYSTSANDPDGDQVKYTFDWADGTTSVTGLVNSGTAASASHTWTVPSGTTSTFNVRARSTDSKGLSSADWSNPLTVTITGPDNRAPTTPSIPSGPASRRFRNFVSYTTSANDLDGDQVKYTFDWADGTTSVTGLVNSGTAASATHRWTVPSGTTSTFNVRARSTDSKGLSSTDWSNPLTVTITGPDNRLRLHHPYLLDRPQALHQTQLG